MNNCQEMPRIAKKGPCERAWQIEVGCISDLRDRLFFNFRVSFFENVGVKNRRTHVEGMLGGELGQKGGLWKSKIGFGHVTNPGNHEN